MADMDIQTAAPTQAEEMPSMVVDRSPELMRGARTPGPLAQTVGRLPMPDLAECTPGDGEVCALAQALMTVWPGCTPHIQGEHPYVIMADGSRQNLSLTSTIVTEIGKFDRGDPTAFKGLVGFKIHRGIAG